MDVETAETPMEASQDPRVHRVELIISNLLRIGVTSSLAIIVIGTIISFVRHPTYLHSREDYHQMTTPGLAKFPHTIVEVIHGVANAQGQAIVALGLLLLISTPVVRVGVSIFAFVYQHDSKFVVITTIVFLLLLLSFLLGKVEG
jgi:uncharacterized membrane protein